MSGSASLSSSSDSIDQTMMFEMDEENPTQDLFDELSKEPIDMIRVKKLVNEGANILKANSFGFTPFDLGKDRSELKNLFRRKIRELGSTFEKEYNVSSTKMLQLTWLKFRAQELAEGKLKVESMDTHSCKMFLSRSTGSLPQLEDK